jgi:hypothetical protein
MIGRAQLSEIEDHLGDYKPEPTLESVRDEMEIRRVVDEIDNLCDRKEWKKLRALFADEVATDFTSLSGGEPAVVPAEDLVGAWQKNLFAAKKTFHQRSNHRIEITGDEAEVFSKGYAFNLLEEGEAAGFWEVWGIYTHRLTRTAAGWKCSGMTLEVVCRRGDDRVRTYMPEQTETK